tara:strand:+ start:1545 stop:2309 length:765 start_codon:yes stop_codon:yes gene_type:complete
MEKADKKEILNSSVKSLFGAVPFAGAALDELFFEYNGRVKQKRLNDFVQILADGFTEESEVNINNIKTEDFNDLFESVIRRVVQTKSKLKQVRFKDILIKELCQPTERAEIIDHYLDLISTLTEEEITILYHHRHFDKEFEKEIHQLNLLKDNLKSLDQKMRDQSMTFGGSEYQKPYDKVNADHESQKKKLDAYQKYRSAEFYTMNEKSFLFYKQRLVSRGLLIDNPRNVISHPPFANMGITEFGNDFIEFIKK